MSTGNISEDSRGPFLDTFGNIIACGETYSRVWSGGDDPVYHSQNNSYDLVISRSNDPFITYQRNYGDGTPAATIWKSSAHRTFGIPSFSDPVFNSNDELKLLSKLISSVRGHGFDAGIALGEHQQTLRLIGSSARKIAKSIRYLQKGNIRGAARTLGITSNSKFVGNKSVKSLSNHWLELQYGWMPLVSDVYEGTLALINHFNKPLRTKVRKSTFRVKSTTFEDVFVGSATSRYDKGYIFYFEEEDPIETTAQNLGLTNPAGVAWEVLPYSFVIDWFIPVGMFLNVMSGFRTIKPVEVITWEKTERQSTIVSGVGGPNGYTMDSFSAETYNLHYHRSVSSILPYVPLPKAIDVTGVKSFRHAVSGVALLVSRLF